MGDISGQGIQRVIERRDVFHPFTDLGLLPNPLQSKYIYIYISPFTMIINDQKKVAVWWQDINEFSLSNISRIYHDTELIGYRLHDITSMK